MSRASRRPAYRAPIRITGRDEQNGYWAASRAGEPAFRGVQDLGDAINASCTRGDVPILVSESVYAEMHLRGDAWFPIPGRVWIVGPATTHEAPIELLGFDPERNVILARRDGEPDFLWVQDLEDAYQAAASRGGVDIVVTRQVRDELLELGHSPLEVQGLRIS